MTESRRRQRGRPISVGPDLGDDPDGGNTATCPEGTCDSCPDPDYCARLRGDVGLAGSNPNTDPYIDSVPASEAEAGAGTEAIWDAYDQTLAAAVRERDRALDKATSRLASVTAGGYLEYDRSVSIALAAFESAWHNARLAHAAVPR